MFTTGHVTPRTRLLESISLILDRLSEEDWDVDKEMIGWELGDSLVRLEDNVPCVPVVVGVLQRARTTRLQDGKTFATKHCQL